MSNGKKNQEVPVKQGLMIIGFSAVAIFFMLFTLAYLPLFVTDILATAQGVPFRHAEMQVYECDSVMEISSFEVLEEYTIFKGAFGDKLIKNEAYSFDHCKVTKDSVWCCMHYHGD